MIHHDVVRIRRPLHVHRIIARSRSFPEREVLHGDVMRRLGRGVAGDLEGVVNDGDRRRRGLPGDGNVVNVLEIKARRPQVQGPADVKDDRAADARHRSAAGNILRVHAIEKRSRNEVIRIVGQGGDVIDIPPTPADRVRAEALRTGERNQRPGICGLRQGRTPK